MKIDMCEGCQVIYFALAMLGGSSILITAISLVFKIFI